MIIFDFMQRFYYLIVKAIDVKMQVNWSIKGVKFGCCVILKLWAIASLISIYDAELADDRNQVDAKIDPRWHAFFITHGVPFCSNGPFCPDLLYIKHNRGKIVDSFCRNCWL